MAVSLAMDILPLLVDARSYIEHNEKTNHSNDNDPLVRKLSRLIDRVVLEVKNGQ